MLKTKLKIFLFISFFLFSTSIFPGLIKDQVIITDNWISGEKEDLIPGWKIQVKKKPLDISVDDGILHLKSQNSSFGLIKLIKLSVKEYPYIIWEWKISQCPENGDFRYKKTDDEAGQLYIFFSKFPVLNKPEIFAHGLGYLWDNVPPKGTIGTSPAWFKLKCMVIRNNTDTKNVWVREKRNIYEDYKKMFNKEPPPVVGVALYINSQHTKSGAEASIGSIHFSKD